MQSQSVDLLVVGGGINGTGIARDAAGRGLSVMLCERDDLAGATSSASSKLIHGGLRYLEHYEFALVRKALKEREVLLRAAPHLVWPLEFVLPQGLASRPGWMLRIGLLLYDRLGGRQKLPRSRSVNLRGDPAGGVLKDEFRRGFVYADCWADDARLVVANAMDAAARGATILTRTELVSAAREAGQWRAVLRDRRNGRTTTVATRVLVNAAGPWAADLMTDRIQTTERDRLRLVKGSHIVLPRLTRGDEAYLLQNTDGRVVFVLPFQERYSLVGTTEVELPEMPDTVTISPEEVDYLCGAVNRYFRKSVAPSDVVWSFAGVRPLVDDAENDPSSVTRDFLMDLDAPHGEAPLLSVLGGKLTTYRVLSEQALALLGPHLPNASGPWTAQAVLPGGDLPEGDFERLLADILNEYPWLPSGLARRLSRSYGSRTRMILGKAGSLDDLGAHYGDGVYEAEIGYLLRHEWLETVDDFLWRRSKLGLVAAADTVARLRARLTSGTG
ncbi:glycerol-3-phosphate dehydrogenase [Iodidimonas sp. SYSU 1G8]|uniref:glycerol-3-phosphate dehydrogenase n=1 Tax=Iodidimonas sp. SYSU 1G8 TaxID=3133967 RepID=UPI0031FEF915